ncbi:MAG: phosphotransferase [Demequina sp.]
MPDADPIHVSDEAVRKLVDEQFPDLAGRELGRRYTLEDQYAMRIGDDYGAIFPRIAEADEFYERSAALIAGPASAWTFPSSHPIATGLPGHGFPYHWTLVPWVTASTAGFVPLDGESARPFGQALREVHVASPSGAPLNPRTGMGLPALREEFESLLDVAARRGALDGHILHLEAIRTLFARGVEASGEVKFTWTHGRLEPRAVLSDQGQFAGILMWYYFGAGDPAADLGYGANLLSRDMHANYWAGYGTIDAALGARADAYQVYATLRYLELEDPFLIRMAWDRLNELELAREA